jgi:hypothetical protein
MKTAPNRLRELQRNLKLFLFTLSTIVLSACGGGGGGGSSATIDPSVRAPLPQLVQDTEPVGPRIGTAGQVYFPTALGDSWDYSYTENGAAKPGITRSISASNPTGFTIRTLQAGGAPDFQNYLKTGNGNATVTPIPTIPLAAQALIGDLIEYPEPFYPMGGVRVSIRQGNWGADLDGDGVNESVRFEFRQIFVGFETITLPLGSATAAHFRNTIAFTISPSKLTSQPVTISATQDDWWALNIGLVRRDNITSTANGGFTTASMQITGGTVGGVVLFPPPLPPALDGSIVKIELQHNDLIYDRLRSRYYASISSRAIENSNRIAIIDASTGSITYSANPVGSDPGSLAISTDGSVLYAGLNGTGEVVKLALPGVNPVSSVQLPMSNNSGQIYAGKIAVSPIDPDVIAVSLRYVGYSPNHAGVALIRNSVIQTRQTQTHTGSNLIVFDASGQFLYGFNNETAEYGLRKIQVLSDGLAEILVVGTNPGYGLVSLQFSVSGNIVLGNTLRRSSDLQLIGTVSSTVTGCRSIDALRLVCLQTADAYYNGRILIAVANSFVSQTSLVYNFSPSAAAEPFAIVPGPAGQIAIRNSAGPLGGVPSIWLFTSPSLQ